MIEKLEFTEDELDWFRSVSNKNPGETSPSAYYKVKTQRERENNKATVRKELDLLVNSSEKYKPQQLLNERVKLGIHSFSGIYIICNTEKDTRYVGKSESVLDRVCMHFVKGKGNSDIYNDFIQGDIFYISLIPLESTSYNSLNELEDNAIRAYDSFINGYNKMEGNMMDSYIFKNDEYREAAQMLLERIKNTEEFLTLSNNDKRIIYSRKLFSELGLPKNTHFRKGLISLIKDYHRNNKKQIREKLRSL